MSLFDRLFDRLFGKPGDDRKNTQAPTTSEAARGVVLSPTDRVAANRRLAIAAESGDVQGTATWINKGADVNAVAYDRKRNPLEIATIGGHHAVVALLLASGAKIVGGSPLHEAVIKGDEDVVKLLCAKQTNVNAAAGDHASWTPLFWAICRHHSGIAEILIANGASVNGDLLKEAIERGHKDIVEMLLAHGANVNEVNCIGQTPLHKAVNKGHMDIVELLISRGADVNAAEEDGEPPLHGAARAGWKDIAELLIARGADVNAASRTRSGTAAHTHRVWVNNYTPLHLVSWPLSVPPKDGGIGHREIVAMLIAHGANVNAVDEDGRTPLHHAVQHADIAELLIAGGANVSARDKRGRPPGWAPGMANEVRELLRRHGAEGI